jgi:hypothetical protein
MPQIFFQYQSTIDQFEGGRGKGSTTQMFSDAMEIDLLESTLWILGWVFRYIL